MGKHEANVYVHIYTYIYVYNYVCALREGCASRMFFLQILYDYTRLCVNSLILQIVAIDPNLP